MNDEARVGEFRDRDPRVEAARMLAPSLIDMNELQASEAVEARAVGTGLPLTVRFAPDGARRLSYRMGRVTAAIRENVVYEAWDG